MFYHCYTNKTSNIVQIRLGLHLLSPYMKINVHSEHTFEGQLDPNPHMSVISFIFFKDTLTYLINYLIGFYLYTHSSHWKKVYIFIYCWPLNNATPSQWKSIYNFLLPWNLNCPLEPMGMYLGSPHGFPNPPMLKTPCKRAHRSTHTVSPPHPWSPNCRHFSINSKIIVLLANTHICCNYNVQG